MKRPIWKGVPQAACPLFFQANHFFGGFFGGVDAKTNHFSDSKNVFGSKTNPVLEISSHFTKSLFTKCSDSFFSFQLGLKKRNRLKLLGCFDIKTSFSGQNLPTNNFLSLSRPLLLREGNFPQMLHVIFTYLYLSIVS